MAVITSSNYWKVVFDELQERVEDNGREKYLLIGKRYDEAIKSIEDRIIAWYGRHALDGKIPLKQAYKKLPPDQLEQFHELIQFYLRNWNEELGYEIGEKPIDHAEKVSGKDTDAQTLENLLDEEHLNDTETWLDVLREYETKEDVTYFEALSIPILNEVEEVSHSTAEELLALLVLTGWVVHHDIAKNLKIQGLSQDKLKKELLKAWAADNMSLYDRFNTNKAKLSASVKSALVKGFRNEMTVDEVVKEVSKVMNVGEAVAKRLVVTENTHFSTYATYLAIKEAGYTEYQYFSRMTANTCEDCMALHLSIFPIEAFEEGVTAPSMHPYCVCYIKPVLGSEVIK